MICTNCNNGFLCEPITKPLLLAYRGFTKHVATEVFMSCSNCSYEDVEPLEAIVDVDAELAIFKREINRQLSTGEIL